MKAIVFAGASLPAAQIHALPGFVALPPAAQGDVFKAVELRPQAIGIVDGYFDGQPPVWHKEILWALNQGVHVFGAASMGALRAAELHHFGMRGVGRVFEDYRDGALEDDDEVALLHAPASAAYQALTLAMVDLRSTLEAAVRDGVIGKSDANLVTAAGKSVFYQRRRWSVVLEAATAAGIAPAQIVALEHWLPEGEVSQKRQDAAAMLEQMRDFLANDPPPFRASFNFEWTEVWDLADFRTGQSTGVGGTEYSKAGIDEGAAAAAVLDELRLNGDECLEVTRAALLRLLARREVDRVGRRVSADQRATELLRLRHTLNLQRQADLVDWAARNAVDEPSLRRLLDDAHKVGTVAKDLGDFLEPYVIDELRVRGRYEALAGRANRKRRWLAETEESRDTASETVRRTDLLSWYFGHQLGQSVPEDLDAYLENQYVIDRTHFFCILETEFLYSESEQANKEGVSRGQITADGVAGMALKPGDDDADAQRT